MIPHSRPRFSQPMQQAVTALLQAGQVTAGGEVVRLEQALCDRLGRRCAVVVDSGTSALMLALRLLARNRDPAEMRVGIPAFGCASLLWAVRGAGMQPYTLDCDPETLALRNDASQAGLDAVVVVHPFGMVEPLVEAAWGCPVIEDIAQSAGARWHGNLLGSKGRITVASLHATKPWGGAYGGALLLDDDSEAVALRRMIDPDGVGVVAGYVGHHQLSDVHALLARMRLEQSDDLMAQRAEVGATLVAWLRQAGAELCSGVVGNGFRLLFRSANDSASALACRFRDCGVAVSLPIKQPLSRMTGERRAGAEEAFSRWVSLPLLADCSAEEMTQMRDAITKVLA
ncbi:MAG: DegT/DnrJ/EryC1/StrS family aminotransferase [Mariprofundales bacterium]